MINYPIGIHTFEGIRRENYVYVDKTELVYRLKRGGRHYLLCRPRLFGKSLLLSTIQSYFKGEKDLFNGLMIADLEKSWHTHAVLKFDFQDPSLGKEEDALDKLIDTQLSSLEQIYGRDESESSIKDRFLGLIQRAYKASQRGVVILIDNYDSPILATMEDSTLQLHYIDILTEFYSVLPKALDKIRFSFICGITAVGKASFLKDYVYSGSEMSKSCNLKSHYKTANVVAPSSVGSSQGMDTTNAENTKGNKSEDNAQPTNDPYLDTESDSPVECPITPELPSYPATKVPLLPASDDCIESKAELVNEDNSITATSADSRFAATASEDFIPMDADPTVKVIFDPSDVKDKQEDTASNNADSKTDTNTKIDANTKIDTDTKTNADSNNDLDSQPKTDSHSDISSDNIRYTFDNKGVDATSGDSFVTSVNTDIKNIRTPNNEDPSSNDNISDSFTDTPNRGQHAISTVTTEEKGSHVSSSNSVANTTNTGIKEEQISNDTTSVSSNCTPSTSVTDTSSQVAASAFIRDISLDSAFTGLCGFSEDEILDNMREGLERLAEYKESDVQSVMEAFTRRYYGYHFNIKGHGKYNPYDVFNALSQDRIGDYWCFVMKSSGIKDLVISKIMTSEFDMRLLKECKIPKSELERDPFELDSPIALLYQCGYLTIMGHGPQNRMYYLTLSNKEVREEFLAELLDCYGCFHQDKGNYITAMLEDLQNGFPEIFVVRMKSFFQDPEDAGYCRYYPQTSALKMTNFPLYCQNILYLVFTLLSKDVLDTFGQEIGYEINDGNAELIMQFDHSIYIFEFVLDKDMNSALRLLQQRHLQAPIIYEGKKIVKVCVSVSSELRNISSWFVEKDESPEYQSDGDEASAFPLFSPHSF